MHKLVSNDILAEDPNNLKVIKYFDPLSFHNPSLNKPNICAKFKNNRWIALYGSGVFSHRHSLNIKITTLRYAKFKKKNSRFIAVLR